MSTGKRGGAFRGNRKACHWNTEDEMSPADEGASTDRGKRAKGRHRSGESYDVGAPSSSGETALRPRYRHARGLRRGELGGGFELESFFAPKFTAVTIEGGNAGLDTLEHDVGVDESPAEAIVAALERGERPISASTEGAISDADRERRGARAAAAAERGTVNS